MRLFRSSGLRICCEHAGHHGVFYGLIYLSLFRKTQSFQLDESLSEDSLDILSKNGLAGISGEAFDYLKRARAIIEQQIESTNKEQLESLQKEIREQHNFLLEALREDVFDVLNDQFG